MPGKSTPGGPTTRFMDQIEKDIKVFLIQNWKTVVKNRGGKAGEQLAMLI